MAERRKAEQKSAEQHDNDEKKEVKFPELTPVKPAEIAGMSHEDKLKLIENEAQTLYDFCLEKGLSKRDMSFCLKPLFGSPPEYVKKVIKDNSRFCMTVAVILGLVAMFMGWSPAYNQLCIHGKLALMKVLPYWDWTYLYEKDCLLRNPYIAPLPNITKEECLACFDVKKNGIEGLSNASLEVIANDFLLSDFPVIIEDSLKDWPDPDITLPKLADQYKNHKDLDNVGDCRFNSSNERLTTVYEFADAYIKGELTAPYFVSWDNCDLKAAKHFRLHYKRPYFLPPMAEAAKTNVFLVAEGIHEESVPLQIEEEASGIWITVIQGELLVDLVPIDGCSVFKGCATITNKLKAGEGVLLPTRLWMVDVTPIAEGITIVLGSTAQWDEAEPVALPEEGQEGGAPQGMEGDQPQGGAEQPKYRPDESKNYEGGADDEGGDPKGDSDQDEGGQDQDGGEPDQDGGEPDQDGGKPDQDGGEEIDDGFDQDESEKQKDEEPQKPKKMKS